MKIFALSDLHLSFGGNKPMDIFGDRWRDHADKIAAAWGRIGGDDLVLIAGDVSWAMKLRDTAADFAYLRALPGHKVFIRGNHDYWWDSLKKNHAAAGDKFYFIQNNAVVFGDLAVTGTRLWNFPFVKWEASLFVQRATRESAASAQEPPASRGEDAEKIRAHELERLRRGLDALPRDAKLKIVLTHFPPIGADAAANDITRLLADYGVQICLYGHLHGLLTGGEENTGGGLRYDCVIDGTRYVLTSADYLNFTPLEIAAG
ncbi:MAG: metallophosphoesterase [Planctomycetota bacterium]|jgi:predicted phosphohydrolase|nr:metallophosphoesterase [Planctomycetota bacterium]